jgi:hypothetical protein
VHHRGVTRTYLVSITVIISSMFPVIPAFSQVSERNCDENPIVTLPESPLDVHLGLAMDQNSEAKFKISFMNTGTLNPHPHIDYWFEIRDSNGTLVFNASPPGQPTLHTAEGVVTIPYTFQKSGDYSVDVTVTGVDFIPTIPQIATFPCNDIPEFSVGLMGIVGVVMAGIVVVSRIMRTGFSDRRMIRMK